MKMFFDLLPLILFFAAYKLGDIYVATGTLMVAMGLQVAYAWIRHKKVEKMLLWSFVAVLVFGALTLVLRNPEFIKWKPSIFNWGFGVVFLFSPYVVGRPLVQKMMEQAIALSDSGWIRLNLVWVGFFVLSGVLNIIVAHNFSEDTWVNFKLFGLTGLSVVFMLGQVFLLRNYLIEPEPVVEGEAEPVPPPETSPS